MSGDNSLEIRASWKEKKSVSRAGEIEDLPPKHEDQNSVPQKQLKCQAGGSSLLVIPALGGSREGVSGQLE